MKCSEESDVSIGEGMSEVKRENEQEETQEQMRGNVHVKSVAGHIISACDEYDGEKPKKAPESVLDVDEHMTEKEKLSLMDKKQKKEYIMEYYAPKAIFALIIVGIVAFLVVKHFTAGNAVLNILAVNTTQQESAADEKTYYEDFLAENGIDTDKEYVSISTGIGVSTDPDDAMSQDSLQLVQNKFMAGAVDVFFADSELVLSLGEFGYMQNLDLVLSDELKDKYKDSFVYATVIETGEKMPVGIKIGDNQWVKDTGWYGTDVAVGFGENAKNMELAEKFLEYIGGR